jgi:hypothetical protein
MSKIQKREKYWRVRGIKKWQKRFFLKNGETFLKKHGLSAKIRVREILL